jgi:hypothetical protein
MLAAAGVLLVAGQRFGPLRYLLAGLAFLIAAWVDWPDEWVPIALAIVGLLCLGTAVAAVRSSLRRQ